MLINKIVTRCRIIRFWQPFFLTVALLPMFMSTLLLPQIHEPGEQRKMISRIEPDYPETLKRLYIGGVVRVEAVITSSGTVESTQLIGGNPILGQSAMKAIKQWKYAPAGTKEKLLVKVEFDPHR